MVRKLPLVAGSFMIAALTSFAASAGTFEPQASTQTSLVEKAQWGDPYYDRGYHYGYRRSCRFWRRECARRWGWGGREYRRCLRRHGCGGGYLLPVLNLDLSVSAWPALVREHFGVDKARNLRNQRRAVMRALPDLQGKALACWCPLNAPCHATTLLELANGKLRELPAPRS